LKSKLLKCTGLVIGLIFVFSLFSQSAAAVVWSDNFDDGNYDGWTVTEGAFDVIDGCLVQVSDGDLGHSIWHESSQVVGTWSLDVFFGKDIPDTLGLPSTSIEFMGNGTDSYTVSIGDLGIKFSIRGYPLSYVEIGNYTHTWTHIDITRNSTGGFHVYVNATSTTAEPILTVVDTTYSYSERFVIGIGYQDEARIDNIVVDDEILIRPPAPTTPDTTTPPDTTTTNGGITLPMDTVLLITGAGVAGIVIVAAVVFMRRR